MQVWSAHAAGKMKESDRSAEHAVAADRFARKIVRFLMSAFAARSRQLNGNPLDGGTSTSESSRTSICVILSYLMSFDDPIRSSPSGGAPSGVHHWLKPRPSGCRFCSSQFSQAHHLKDM